MLSMTDFASDITHVTYKEVMIFWGLQPGNAANRLTFIRNTLNKQRFQKITVQQYCAAEDISIDEFTRAINRYYNNMKKAS
jgi:hypothetical protein